MLGSTGHSVAPMLAITVSQLGVHTVTHLHFIDIQQGGVQRKPLNCLFETGHYHTQASTTKKNTPTHCPVAWQQRNVLLLSNGKAVHQSEFITLGGIKLSPRMCLHWQGSDSFRTQIDKIQQCLCFKAYSPARAGQFQTTGFGERRVELSLPGEELERQLRKLTSYWRVLLWHYRRNKRLDSTLLHVGEIRYSLN